MEILEILNMLIGAGVFVAIVVMFWRLATNPD
jgi:hypothetical protein